MIRYKSPIIICLIALWVLCCRPGERPLQQGKIAQPEKGIPISNMPKVDTAEIKLLLGKAENLFKAGYIDSAMIYTYEALHLSQQINAHGAICQALFGLGGCYTIKKNFNKANTLYFRALYYLDLSKNTEEKRRSIRSDIYNAIGTVYFHTNQYDSSLRYLYGSLAELKKMKFLDTPRVIAAYINIAAPVEPIDAGRTRAISYMQRAKSLAETYKKDTLSLALACHNMATLYHNHNMDYLDNNIDSAIAYLKEALHYYRQLPSKRDISIIYNNISAAYLDQKDIGQAVLYLDSALTMDSKIGNTHAGVNGTQGDILYFQGYLKQAVPYYLKALHLAEANLEDRIQINIYEKLAKLYDSIGKGHLAYQYLGKHVEIKNRISTKEARIATSHLEVKFRSSEKDAELATKNLDVLKKKVQIQRRTALIWITSLSTLLLLISFIFLRRQQVSKLRRLEQQKELDLLKATIEGEDAERIRVGQELHDGVSGMLSAIKMNLVALRINRKDIASESNFITTMELADEAADELRKTAHNLVPSSLVNKGITKAIVGFCDRVNASLSIQLQVLEDGMPQRLEPAKELILYRIIQELAHNMIKHSRATEGILSFSWQEQLLLITVEDNGIGITEVEQEQGIGLQNIDKRVKALHGCMEIKNIEGEGTSIYLEFPLEGNMEVS